MPTGDKVFLDYSIEKAEHPPDALPSLFQRLFAHDLRLALTVSPSLFIRSSEDSTRRVVDRGSAAAYAVATADEPGWCRMRSMERYLICTPFVDCDTAIVKDTARSVTAGSDADKERAVGIYYFVRDRIRHNPYAPCQVPDECRASATLERGHGFCQHKAILLVALARALGIPARIGLVDVRDHLLSPRFREMIGGDNLLIQHGYAELYLNGNWLHVSPAYDLETCRKAGFVPVEFDGVSDARDSAHDVEGKPHIEHVKDHGQFDDFPWNYVKQYQKEWVSRIGREWSEFTDNVKRHEAS